MLNNCNLGCRLGCGAEVLFTREAVDVSWLVLQDFKCPAESVLIPPYQV